MDKGLLIVLSGPSGVGKGTVCAALRKRLPNLVYSVSATTRKPRAGEVDGVNYFFKSHDEFKHMIEHNELLEWAQYVSNFYGTPRTFVEETLASGKDVILEIEVQGAMKVKQQFDEGIFIFLMPPSLDELRSRIVGRGTEALDQVNQRMLTAVDEIKLLDQYDYAVVNDQVELACDRIISILQAEHCRKERIMPKIQQWIDEVSK